MISYHMRQLRQSGVGVLVLSWYPPGLADENGLPTDEMVLPLLDAAGEHGLKVALLVEPYEQFNASNFRNHLEYVHSRYVDHPAFYRRRVGAPGALARELPVFYLYDSYRVAPEEWQRLLSRYVAYLAAYIQEEGRHHNFF